jgi:acyl-coenzyme A synthetase/AMP-(fatty) acid ligase/acyl carrier protein
LCSGGTICIPETREIVLDADRLIDWINDRRINLVHCVPTVFRVLSNQQRSSNGFPCLEYVLIAGEQLFPADVRKWMSIYGGDIQLVNLYGPTETTLAKFCHFVTPSDAARRLIPVGKPIEGVRALVLSDDGRPCPQGVVGEILIKPPFNMLGYYNQPAATKEVFVPNPITGDPQDIVYRTGDLGRVLKHGEFELLGRRDGQVKVRGIRVELGEIEALLRDYRGISDAVVKEWRDSGGETFLCAYFVSARKVERKEIRAFLKEYLPEEMIPSAFVRLEELPLNLNGKVDRMALQNPSEIARKKTEYVAPRNEIEERLVLIWRKVLQVQQIGINDVFYDLGGHSLNGIQMMLRVNKEFQVDLPLKVLFELPTIAELAIAIVLRRAERLGDELVTRSLEEISRLPEEEVRKMVLIEEQLLEGEADA